MFDDVRGAWLAYKIHANRHGCCAADSLIISAYICVAYADVLRDMFGATGDGQADAQYDVNRCVPMCVRRLGAILSLHLLHEFLV